MLKPKNYFFEGGSLPSNFFGGMMKLKIKQSIIVDGIIRKIGDIIDVTPEQTAYSLISANQAEIVKNITYDSISIVQPEEITLNNELPITAADTENLEIDNSHCGITLEELKIIAAELNEDIPEDISYIALEERLYSLIVSMAQDLDIMTEGKELKELYLKIKEKLNNE